jgi:hypothetical protein
MDALKKLFNSVPDGSIEQCRQDAFAAVDAHESKHQNAALKVTGPDDPRVQPRSAPGDLNACRSLLDEVAGSESTDFRADARRVAQRFPAVLSAEALDLLRTELEAELARRRPAIVPAAQLTMHSRRLAVLEAAKEVLSDKRRDA